MNRIPYAILISLSLCGCTVFQPVATNRADRSPKVTPEQIAGLPPGSRVIIHQQESTDSYTQSVGIVLHASPQGVALMNCIQSICRDHSVPVLNRTPYLSRLFKTTGFRSERVPVQWISIRQITSIGILEPPPADYVAPQIAIDTREEEFFERIGVDFNFSVTPVPGASPAQTAGDIVVPATVGYGQ